MDVDYGAWSDPAYRIMFQQQTEALVSIAASLEKLAVPPPVEYRRSPVRLPPSGVGCYEACLAYVTEMRQFPETWFSTEDIRKWILDQFEGSYDENWLYRTIRRLVNEGLLESRGAARSRRYRIAGSTSAFV